MLGFFVFMARLPISRCMVNTLRPDSPCLGRIFLPRRVGWSSSQSSYECPDNLQSQSHPKNTAQSCSCSKCIIEFPKLVPYRGSKSIVDHSPCQQELNVCDR